MQPTSLQIARQARWERIGNDRAMKAVRESLEDAERKGAGHTTAPAQALLRAIVPPLEAAITAAQAEARQILAAPGRTPGWAWPIGLLSADKLAVITTTNALRAAMNSGRSKEGAETSGMTAAAEAVAQAVRDEIEFERWEAEQKERNKAVSALKAKTGQGDEAADATYQWVKEGHKDLLKALEATYPNVSRAVWARWRAKVQALREEKWSKADTAIPLGEKLLHELSAVASDRITIAHRGISAGRTQITVELTEKAEEEMRDIKTRMEVARPRLMPMVIPPNPWRYEA